MEVSSFTHRPTLAGLRGPSPLLRLQSDERLIALTRRGQHAAFEVLCARYQARLLAFVRHMLGSRVTFAHPSAANAAVDSWRTSTMSIPSARQPS